MNVLTMEAETPREPMKSDLSPFDQPIDAGFGKPKQGRQFIDGEEFVPRIVRERIGHIQLLRNNGR